MSLRYVHFMIIDETALCLIRSSVNWSVLRIFYRFQHKFQGKYILLIRVTFICMLQVLLMEFVSDHRHYYYLTAYKVEFK